MTVFYRFLSEYEALIYILLAIGALFAFRAFWRAWRESQTAVFTLERQFSSRRLAQSASISALIVVLFCAVFFTTTFIVPGLPASAIALTPTLDFISTPTGVLSPEMMSQFAAAPLQAAPGASGCVPGRIMLTFPEPGAELKGSVELIGTVNIPNFGFYKYEAARVGSDAWATISANRSPVENGSLGRWNTTALTPGDYQLRLVVTDNQGVVLPPCIIPVRVAPIQ
jgi:hypothetical protein